MGISFDELKILADKKGFDLALLEKDYLLTELLYIIKDIKGIYFKGGTALNKILLCHKRLSEDLDFTLTRKLSEVEKDIKDRLKGTRFKKITHDKRVSHFVRLIAHYKLFHEEGTIFINLNARAKIRLKPQKTNIPHFYKGYIPEFKVKTLNIKELIAEKICAMVQRYAPRDYYDIYNIIKKKLPIDMKLVKQKFKDDNEEFDISRIFKRSYRIHNKWEIDLLPLTTTKPSFKEVMQTLTRFFKYKEHKEALKEK
ncbi:MAG: nucleotidyl transferase AbiEii/AbiGii toxin family protein [Nanoarchaeota archaeon]|nr:nucleotidyl transferase AbiEii/AbiGii toxin family protein [Nanoarchaeota archaeon]MCG2717906.1 nucleotidyl transferase AbiEii/AbiGii toxin family protein [Nanoarchaeota archaeon]